VNGQGCLPPDIAGPLRALSRFELEMLAARFWGRDPGRFEELLLQMWRERTPGRQEAYRNSREGLSRPDASGLGELPTRESHGAGTGEPEPDIHHPRDLQPTPDGRDAWEPVERISSDYHMAALFGGQP
jgi:hypothetical protein